MVRLRIRYRCVALAFILSQVLVGFWFFQPMDPAKQFLKRLFTEGGQTILHLRDQPTVTMYAAYGKDLCVREGTLVKASSEGNCVCRPGWKGKRCGVPEIMQRTDWMQNPDLSKNIQLRKRPRRVILVSPFIHEYDIFEANVNELVGLVDVFVIGETNYTVASNNSLPILSKLKDGWLKDTQNRIIYVPVRESDLKKRSFVQNLVQTGLRLVSDIRPDDLFILTNGEEILRRDVVTFLKLFQGYPLPVKCQFKHYMYGFYWSLPENSNLTKPEVCASSFQFLANAFEYQVSRLQEGSVLEEDLNFFTSHEQPVVNWTIPEAGWRCHLCLSVENIFQKLSSRSESPPKWLLPSSSYSSISPFIQRLIKFGQDENLEPVGVPVHNIAEEELPPYLNRNKEKFAHFFKNPYETASIHNLV
ncbi:beta-1,4-mannosyl-glycoprotein 4-beta-N-acetylglucosaminyltransferase-like [Macrobrachium nipponense]|uniref:beta-1,4-mannosyl-glycoprotein 4-beta-N-acetylglucosaminyltransferase-like n=1 Tax=Macrobrachium nipponense TaxID=159736 RepID=UPI0030C8A011